MIKSNPYNYIDELIFKILNRGDDRLTVAYQERVLYSDVLSDSDRILEDRKQLKNAIESLCDENISGSSEIKMISDLD